MVCDRIAASKNYKGDKYTDAAAWEYYDRSRDHYILHTAQDFRVCNLNSEHCAVFSPTCEMLETNMDNIELHIARSYLLKNLELLEG